jgi:predicted DNA-binding transcriptional regulator YafY
MSDKGSSLDNAILILEILKRIPTKSRVTTNEIKRSLEQAGINIEKRRLQRYLKQMTDSGKFGIVCDNSEKTYYGYRREKKGNILGEELQLQPNECLLLCLTEKLLRYQIPGPTLDSMKWLFEEAKRCFAEEDTGTRKQQAWMEKVAVVPSFLTYEAPKILPRIFGEVSDALYRNLKLRLTYIDNAKKTSTYTISPLGLVQQGVRLYLVCKRDEQKDIVHLALHRIQKTEATCFPVDRPKDFNLQEYISSREFNYNNGELVHWILEFENKITAAILKETPFNKTQTLKKNADGVWHLEVDIQDSRYLDGWVAMWKKDAKITKDERTPIEKKRKLSCSLQESR